MTSQVNASHLILLRNCNTSGKCCLRDINLDFKAKEPATYLTSQKTLLYPSWQSYYHPLQSLSETVVLCSHLG